MTSPPILMSFTTTPTQVATHDGWTLRAEAAAPAPAPASPSFADFYAQWREEMAPQWRRTHRQGVDQVFEAHLLPAFGQRPVGSLQRADVLAFRARLSKAPGRSGTLSASRVNKVMVLLHQMMSEAAQRFGFASPTGGIKRLKVAPARIFPFSLGEVQAICAAVRPDYRAYLVTRFFTGMRTGEVDGLRWHSVDVDRGLICVCEVFTAGEHEENVKTSGSFRDVPMLPQVREALLAHRGPTWDPQGHVFTTRTGKPICARNFTNRIWNPLLDRLGLARRRPYQTRHTTATLMLAAGENPEWVARLMGHANTQMLFTVYSRYVPNLTRADGTAISALVDRTWVA